MPSGLSHGAYEAAKLVHVTCVALSISGFIARFVLAWRGAGLAVSLPVRILPHVNDTMLLAAAIAMLTLPGIDPLAATWLVAKLCALAAYIGLGVIALRHRLTRLLRLCAFIAALVVFAYIVGVAVTRNALGPLVWLAR